MTQPPSDAAQPSADSPPPQIYQPPVDHQPSQGYQQPQAYQSAQGYQQPQAYPPAQGYQQPQTYQSPGVYQPPQPVVYQQPQALPVYQSAGPVAYQQPVVYQQVLGPVREPKSKLAAGLLGIFLGGLGVHNFYLGYTGKAVAQLLISVLSIGLLAIVSVIWGLIEGIMILAGSIKTDGYGVPLRD
ncbi:MAG: NINE protein [Bifidobacteriaceae bacterium]|jgi:TM2 domain-containing membrane protein YozV|nr:NINE protein [Bifidobacteriaceae bacterium]